MRTIYQCSLLSLVWLFLIIAACPLQAKVVYNTPPQKVLKKKKIKKRYKKQAYFKRYIHKKKHPANIQESAPSLGAVIGWFLFIWLLWWLLMAIPIILGLVFNLPWLWILGIVLGCLPLLFVLVLFLIVLFSGSQQDRISKKKMDTI